MFVNGMVLITLKPEKLITDTSNKGVTKFVLVWEKGSLKNEVEK